MTEALDPIPPQDVTAENSPVALSLGQAMQEGRKARGLSIADVAQAIKFSPRQIEAIERDEFDKLPGATSVRGFVRSYAKLLRLDPVAMLAMFDRQVPPVAVTMEVLTDTGETLPLPNGGRGALSSVAQWLGVGLALLMLVGAVLYGSLGKNPAPPPVPDATVTAPVSPGASQGAASEVVSAGSGNVPLTMGAVDPVTIDPARAADKALAELTAPPVDPEVQQLIFSFDGKSWVEVKDASTRVIFAQNNLPGTRQVVNGKPPFAVVIGNAPHVQLFYGERQVDLAPHTRVDVARFNLE